MPPQGNWKKRISDDAYYVYHVIFYLLSEPIKFIILHPEPLINHSYILI